MVAGGRCTTPTEMAEARSPQLAGTRQPGAYSVHAACEEAVVPGGRAARPPHTAHRIERLAARIHLLIGHRPIERSTFGPVAPGAAGATPHAVPCVPRPQAV